MFYMLGIFDTLYLLSGIHCVASSNLCLLRSECVPINGIDTDSSNRRCTYNYLIFTVICSVLFVGAMICSAEHTNTRYTHPYDFHAFHSKILWFSILWFISLDFRTTKLNERQWEAEKVARTKKKLEEKRKKKTIKPTEDWFGREKSVIKCDCRPCPKWQWKAFFWCFCLELI